MPTLSLTDVVAGNDILAADINNGWASIESRRQRAGLDELGVRQAVPAQQDRAGRRHRRPGTDVGRHRLGAPNPPVRGAVQPHHRHRGHHHLDDRRRRRRHQPGA